MGETLVIDWQSFRFILVILFLSATIYAFLIYKFVDRLQGYISLLVVGGVLMTLGAAALIDSKAAELVLVCFVFSGTPMVIGDIVRYIMQREKALEIQEKIYTADAKAIESLARELENYDQG